MKIYITGGTGFVGSNLANKLKKKHKVTVGSLNPENSVKPIEGCSKESIDVTDKKTLNFENYDCVIHLVALSPLKKPSIPYKKIHVEGTKNVVKQAEEDGVEKYFHMSALGASKDSETEYLKTKGVAEDFVKKSDLQWRIMKPSTIFGDESQFLDFITTLTTPYITLLPGKYTKFQPIYIEDVIEAIENSLKDKHNNKIFEIGGPEKLTLGKITELNEKSKGKRVKVINLPLKIFRILMIISERIPFSPFGIDQYKSLKSDNITQNNKIEELGIDKDKLKDLRTFLDIN